MSQAWEMTFNQVVDALLPQLQDTEQLKLTLTAEDSQFTRFNRGKVRQTGQVTKGDLTLTLMANHRSASQSVSFTGDKAVDWPICLAALTDLRAELPELPVDPYLVSPTSDVTSREVYTGALSDQVVTEFMPALADVDAAGLYAGGKAIRAYADSAGARHWFETDNFTLDYSLFSEQGQAVKGTYAGRDWSGADYEKTLVASKQLLGQMAQPRKTLERGQYRTYLAPDAVAYLAGMLSWGGIGEAAIRRGEFIGFQAGIHMSSSWRRVMYTMPFRCLIPDFCYPTRKKSVKTVHGYIRTPVVLVRDTKHPLSEISQNSQWIML